MLKKKKSIMLQRVEKKNTKNEIICDKLKLTGHLGAFAETVVQGPRVLVQEAHELSLLAVLIKPRHFDQVSTLQNTHVCAREAQCTFFVII